MTHKLSILCLGVLLHCAGAVHADEQRRPYIVQLTDPPLASYAGGVGDYQPTRPAVGARLDLDAPPVRRYGGYLQQKQAGVRAAIAGAPVSHQYQLTLNGFAAMLTDAEVRALKARGDVARVSADAPRHVVTSHTPAFLGLDRPRGLWQQLGGPAHAGEDVIVGVLDTGVAPENPAFADRIDAAGRPSFDAAAALAYGPAPAAWRGACAAAEGWPAGACNNKLIGATYFNAVFRSVETLHWTEFDSPRDAVGAPVGFGGHGTHTASTAAGNAGVRATLNGAPLGPVSGIAPRARLAVYKVCWTATLPDGTGEHGCFQGDAVAAIEQALRDGVDVLNFSISGGTAIDDPVDLAFLHAANAGVFVAAAAGNDGAAASVGHVAPWLTTVAATTHDRQLRSTLTLANGTTYHGASLTARGVARHPLIRAEDASVAGADPALAALCDSGADGGMALLDPAKAGGKIVVCRRGVTPRIDKSLAVLRAGGVGMVLVDDGAGPVAEVHSVPTVHVAAADGAAIAAYAGGAGAGAALSPFAAVRGGPPAPVVAAFSSRGPSPATADIMKPDLGAPGVEILAGSSPALERGQRDDIAAGAAAGDPFWALLSGTSMAAPHVAGLGALLRQLHPDWSPAAIKSALMTSAGATLADAQAGDLRGVLPWGQGAGQAAPNAAADPGLVFDLAPADYARYLCGAGLAEQCGGGAMRGYDLNLPSITLGKAASTHTVRRSVTHVGAARATYSASASLPGYQVAVTPAALTLAPGEQASFTVTLTRTTAADNTWHYGALVWRDGARAVRVIEAPERLGFERASGSSTLSLATGFAGRMGASVAGLKAVAPGADLTVRQAAYNSVDTPQQIVAACRAGREGVRNIPVSVHAGTAVARFELSDRATGHPGRDDLDLALLDAEGNLAGLSRAHGSDEALMLTDPAPGQYQVCVVGTWIADNTSTSFRLASTLVTTAENTGTLKVMLPPRVYVDGNATAGLSWSGLAPGQRYLGAVRFLDNHGRPGATTVIEIRTDDPVPLPSPVAKQARPTAL